MEMNYLRLAQERKEGIEIGEEKAIRKLIRSKMDKGKSVSEIVKEIDTVDESFIIAEMNKYNEERNKVRM